jgi:hypothetical protein
MDTENRRSWKTARPCTLNLPGPGGHAFTAETPCWSTNNSVGSISFEIDVTFTERLLLECFNVYANRATTARLYKQQGDGIGLSAYTIVVA